MKRKKYGCVLVIIFLVLVAFLLFMNRNEQKKQSEERILQERKEIENIGADAVEEQESTQEGEEASDIGSNAIAEQEESEREVILDEHTLLGNMWMYYKAEEIPFVDEETFAMIREAYEEVEYTAEFETGYPEVYEEYKQKFWRLLQNEVPFWNREMGKEIYLKDWVNSRGELRIDDLERYTTKYYFFDINGDGFPELCVENLIITTIFAYAPDTDQYILWTWLNGMDIAGTKKATRNPEYDTTICHFFQLDTDGNFELETLFWTEYANLYHYDVNMVMFPNYSDEEKRWEITDEMKQQGVYEESSRQWFFRITDEQFEELEKPYMDALSIAEERRRAVRYTYEELFGEYETE